MKNKIAHISLLLVGVVFIVSAVAKAWDGNAFARLITQYGVSWLTAFVPVLIAAETVLGIMLILYVNPKCSAILSASLILFVTCFYVYGLTVRGITDCGCFGSLQWLNTKPWLTFLRNAILIGLCIVGYLFCDKNATNNKQWKAVLVLLFTAANTFVCGLDMGKSFQLPDGISKQDEAFLTLEESGLTKHLPISNDSCYAVYLFSYTCPFCQNSYANVEQYLRVGQIDHVYGLAVADSVSRERFYRIYQPKIEIKEIVESEMWKITSDLPVLYIIERGKITNIEVGSIISPGIMME